MNPTCGDEITLRVKLSGAAGSQVVESVSFDSQGCSISQASASVLHDQVEGVSLDQAFFNARRILVAHEIGYGGNDA